MTLGPVSEALKADLKKKVHEHGLVLWLDAEGLYTDFVDELMQGTEPALPYQLCAFRGSYLDLMFALEGRAGAVDRPNLVIHLPGFNEDAVRASPMLELYRAGFRHRRKLERIITDAAAGRVSQDAVSAFLKRGELSLNKADAWLTGLLQGRDDGGLAADLQVMTLTAILDDLLSGGVISGRIKNSADREILWNQLNLRTGLPKAWRDDNLVSAGHAKDVASCVAGWALAVEYVHDLSRAPVEPSLLPATTLPEPVVTDCGALAAHLRTQHPEFYAVTATETEGRLGEEIKVAQAADLGRIDTFRFEEERILGAAVQALRDSEWTQAEQWAAPRIEGSAFWLRGEPLRRNAWELVLDAARLGQAIAAAGPKLKVGPSLHLAVEAYVQRGAAVDEAHRRLEQKRTALLYPRMPEFDSLRPCLDEMRGAWRQWADSWAVDFNQLCTAQGFLPSADLQQRTLFDEVVRPLTQEAGITAYFMVDAFRYEMAEELRREIQGQRATTVQLAARLAELPSVTEVGMNVLAPVCEQGRLHPEMAGGKIKGFRNGEYRVSTKEHRQRAMQARVGGEACPYLEIDDVLDRDRTTLKQTIARAKLVIVHSIEIDKAGENGAGTAVFGNALQRLRAAWRLLRDAGVRHFVFSADHGFLLLDQYAFQMDSRPEHLVTHGKKTDPERRHVFVNQGADEPGKVRVPLSALDYEGRTEHLVFPETTAVFDKGKKNKSFVHGGNSLQERVIPVLTVSHRAPAGGGTLAYLTRGSAQPAQEGMHALHAEIVVDDAQGALPFGGPPEVALALDVVDDPSVRVELCGISGAARRVEGLIHARVGQNFGVLFRLVGPQEARVRVQLNHPSAELTVNAQPIKGRFSVAAPAKKTSSDAERTDAPAPPPPPVAALDFEGLPMQVRPIFEHIAQHGILTDPELHRMLGSARAARRFANHFDEYKLHAPISVTMTTVAGVKQYMRVGGQA